MSKRDDEKKRHEYLLMEMRLVGEDVKEYVRSTIEPVKKRVTTLEHGATAFGATIGTIGALLGWKWIKN